MSNQDVAKEWLRFAETDLASAEFLWNMKPVPLEIICYHCQQAAEKSLKAFLALHGEPVRKTHDLLLLNRLCAAIDPSFSTIEIPCLMLTDYGVNVRYPFTLEVEEADAVVALQHSKTVVDFVSEAM
jgi:HEPN domain-containing protein